MCPGEIFFLGFDGFLRKGAKCIKVGRELCSSVMRFVVNAALGENLVVEANAFDDRIPADPLDVLIIFQVTKDSCNEECPAAVFFWPRPYVMDIGGVLEWIP